MSSWWAAAFVGCEATVHLQSMGKRVDVVEMADRLMAEADALDDEAVSSPSTT